MDTATKIMIMEGLTSEARALRAMEIACTDTPKVIVRKNVKIGIETCPGGVFLYVLDLRDEMTHRVRIESGEILDELLVGLGDAIAIAIAKTIKPRREAFNALSAPLEQIDIDDIRPDQP